MCLHRLYHPICQMENVHISRPQQVNTTTHVLSCLILPPSPPRPAAADDCPPHHSFSQSLLRNTTTIAHQELKSSCRNAQTASSLIPTLNPCFPLVGSGQPANSAFSAVPVPCKLAMPAAMSKNYLLASLAAAGDGMDINPPAGELAKAADRTLPRSEDANTHLDDTMILARMEQHTDLMEIKKELHKQKDEVSSDGSAIITKRSCHDEEEGNHKSGAALHGSSKGGSGSSNGHVGSVKKRKASPPAPNVPRCQAEDCRIDLSNAKDYHRRHKVCEGHSKCSIVKVANLDQRFCQQCSRFHVLSAFDEGKRSCRRRLAGHNERRRKQQLEPFSLASYTHLAGAKHFLGPSFRSRPYLSNSEDIGADLQDLNLLRESKEKLTGSTGALELYKLMQGSQTGEEHLLLLSRAQAFVQSEGNGVDLTSPLPPLLLTTLAHAACLDCPQPVSETLVSGRALSLLSSSLGFPNTFNCVLSPPGLGVSSSPSLGGHLLDNQHVASQQAVPNVGSGFTPSLPAATEVLPHSHRLEIIKLAGQRSSSPCITMNPQHSLSSILNTPRSSSFTMVQEGEGAMQPVANHMQASAFTMPSHRLDLHHHLTDMESLSVFGRPTLM